MAIALGIDIGGSGVKGAPVDLVDGSFTSERLRIDSPSKAVPASMAAVVREVLDHFVGEVPDGPVGLTIPAPVRHGVVPFVANLDRSWVGLPVAEHFSEALGRPVVVGNDADAVGLAEARYGAASGIEGTVVVVTFGAGIGTAILNDGVLLPNTEFGHLELDRKDAERRAGPGVRSKDDLSWKEWATKRLQPYFECIEKLVTPDLIVVGGRVSKNSDKFLPHLRLRTPIVPAKLRTSGAIVGAALMAESASS